MLVAFTVSPPSANKIPLLLMSCVPPPALSARSSVVLACRLPLLASVPLMRAVTLPASAVILPALVKPLPALRLKLPAVLCMPCAAPVAVVMLPVSAASVMLPAERTAAVPSARLLVVLKASVVPAYKVAPLLPIVRLLALPVKAPPAPHAVPLMLAAPVMARVLLPPAKRVLAAADASLKLAAVVVRLLAAYSSPSASLICPPAAFKARLAAADSLAAPLTNRSSLPLAAVVVTVKSCLALNAACSSILPALVNLKLSALAAASPSMRTPTPASVAMMLMRPLYMPPSAVESMA